MSKMDIFQQFGLGTKSDSDTNNKRTVVYSRVSTKGQEDNTSLANQHEVCMRLVEREGLDVVEEFGGKGESAKSGSARLEYERMLKFVQNQKNRIRYVVFYAYDRFSREGGKAIVTKEKLKQLGITVKSATMPIDTSNPMGAGMEDMQLIFAKMENDVRRNRTIGGMRAKLKAGYWCGQAPTGYFWDNGTILVHPKNGPLIKKAFMLKYENPNLTFEEIRARIKRLGLTIPNQTMTRIMRNPFYCGLIASKTLEGEVVQGKHEALVSPKVFLAVNNILKKTNPSGWRADEENAQLPLKKFLTCECCGRPFTGYLNKTQKGQPRKRPIPYYKCPTKGCKVNLNADKVGQTFLNELERYSTEAIYVPLIATEFKAMLTKRNADQFKEAEAMKKRVSELEKKISRLRERYVVEEAITQEDYTEFSTKMRDEKEALLSQLEAILQKSSNLLKSIDRTIQISSNLAYLWSNGTYRDKQRVQKMVFPDGMSYSKESQKVRTPRVNEIIRASSEMSRFLEAKEKGKVGDFTFFPRSVAPPRIELGSGI